MNKFTVEYHEKTNKYEVVKWLATSSPTSFRGEIVYKSDYEEIAQQVCEAYILDSDPAYQSWLSAQYQESEFDFA